jgi:hypothetical protein
VYEQKVLDSLKTLVDNNKTTLMTGITYQGAAKTIHQITTTNLAPPSGYPYILIYCSGVKEQSNLTEAPTVRHPRRKANYRIRIEVTDQAILVTGDDEAYEQSHRDYRLFIDRLVYLLRTQTWIGTLPKTQLTRAAGDNDRAIDVQNLSGTWQDTEMNWWAILHSQLSFELIDECVDASDAQLYP